MLNLVEVLERYDDRVIEQVSDPATGIVRDCKFAPSIAEVVSACDYHHDRNVRIAELARSPFQRREARPPANVANVLVRKSHPDYDKLVAWAHHPSRDPREWHEDDQDRGIWIGFGGLNPNLHKSPWVRLTEQELLALYGKQNNAPATF
jgi:hypothetical protein